MLTHAQGFTYHSTDDEYKKYQGEVTLTGQYSRVLEQEYLDYMGDNICFYPDATSAKLIPRDKNDMRSVWFCFSNFKTAKATFNIPDQIKSGYCEYKGRATVRIKNYDIFIVESEGSDYAKLLSAKNISPAKAVKCDDWCRLLLYMKLLCWLKTDLNRIA